MVRQYDSSRRKTAAQRTRHDILQAALKLHWQGITEYEPLALEAGCSVATLRKHFPTKETLYQNCTRTFAESLRMPDLPALGAISDREQRIEQNVAELCRIHEAMFGFAWLIVQQGNDSPTLKAEMDVYQGLTDSIADMITPDESTRAPLIRGLLDFLSYRALRLSAQLSAERTAQELISTLKLLILHDTDRPASASQEDNKP